MRTNQEILGLVVAMELEVVEFGGEGPVRLVVGRD